MRPQSCPCWQLDFHPVANRVKGPYLAKTKTKEVRTNVGWIFKLQLKKLAINLKTVQMYLFELIWQGPM